MNMHAFHKEDRIRTSVSTPGLSPRTERDRSCTDARYQGREDHWQIRETYSEWQGRGGAGSSAAASCFTLGLSGCSLLQQGEPILMLAGPSVQEKGKGREKEKELCVGGGVAESDANVEMMDDDDEPNADEVE